MADVDMVDDEQLAEEADTTTLPQDNGTKDHESGEENEDDKMAAYDVSTIQALNPAMRRIRTSVISDDHQVELDYEEELEEGPNTFVASGLAEADDKAEPAGDGQEGDTSKESNEIGEINKSKKEKSKDEEDGEADEEGEAHSTDGELSDDDCEEGEIKEAGLKRPFVRPMCRFYTRGQCTWGNNCRFLHPGVNDKGNYSLIDQGGYPPGMGPPPSRPAGHRMSESGGEPPTVAEVKEEPSSKSTAAAPSAGGTGSSGAQPAASAGSKSAAAAPAAEPENETAWERGLRHAKEMRKRKEGGITEEVVASTADVEKKTEPVAGAGPQEPERPPPFTRHVPPAPRDPYYDELARSGYDADDYYNRLPAPQGGPPPPHDAWGPPPPYGDPYFMRWPPRDYPPEYGMPLPPPPDFRMMDRERMGYGRRLSPPPRFDYYRRDGRYGPPPPGARPPSTEPPYHARGGEAWRDPWLRTRSPRRKRYSSSRSGSRSGSYSSSSSSYTSRSRSSSYSSYTGSSGSSYSYSRSSSGSMSRSPVKGSKRRKAGAGRKALGSTMGQKQGANASDAARAGLAGIQPGSPPTKIASSLGSTVDIASALPSKQALSQAVAAAALDKAGGPFSIPGRSTLAPAPLGAKLVVPAAGRGAPLQQVGKGAAAAFAPEPPAPPRPPPESVSQGFPRVSDLTRLPGWGKAGDNSGPAGKDKEEGIGPIAAGGASSQPGAKGPDAARRRSSRSNSRYRSSSRSGGSRSRSSSRSGSRSSYTPPRKGGGKKSGGGKRNRRGSSGSSSRSSSRSRSAESDKLYGDMASPISSASSVGDKSPSRPQPEKPSAPRAPGDNLRGRSERGDPTQALKEIETRRAAMRGMGRPPHPGMRGGDMYPPMPPGGGRMDPRDMRGMPRMHPRDMRGRPPPPMDYRGPPPPMDMRHPHADFHMRGGMRMPHHREHHREGMRERDGIREHRDRSREPREGRGSSRGPAPPDSRDSRAPSLGGRDRAPSVGSRDRAPSVGGRDGEPPAGPRQEREGAREHHHRGVERHQGVATDRRDIRQGRGEMGASGDATRPRRVSTGERGPKDQRPGTSRADARLRADRGGAEPVSPASRKRPAPDSLRDLSPSAVKHARHSDTKSAGGRSSRQGGAPSTPGVGKSPGKPAATGAAENPGSATSARKKSSTSSRREELLMQLKAVEDAIAKKRSKVP